MLNIESSVISVVLLPFRISSVTFEMCVRYGWMCNAGLGVTNQSVAVTWYLGELIVVRGVRGIDPVSGGMTSEFFDEALGVR